MNKDTSSMGVLEYVNLALAIFSWLFSDIEFRLKVLITIVLVGIIAFSKFPIASRLRQLSVKPIVVLFGSPIFISILVFQLASFCYSENLLSLLDETGPLPVSIVYGLLIGLPIVIISATLSKQKFLGFDLGLVGSFVWFFLIAGLIQSSNDINVWNISLGGPLSYVLAGNRCRAVVKDDWAMVLGVLVSAFVIPSGFYFLGLFWSIKSKLFLE